MIQTILSTSDYYDSRPWLDRSLFEKVDASAALMASRPGPGMAYPVEVLDVAYEFQAGAGS